MELRAAFVLFKERSVGRTCANGTAGSAFAYIEPTAIGSRLRLGSSQPTAVLLTDSASLDVSQD